MANADESDVRLVSICLHWTSPGLFCVHLAPGWLRFGVAVLHCGCSRVQAQVKLARRRSRVQQGTGDVVDRRADLPCR
jgi:hypothetical protein